MSSKHLSERDNWQTKTGNDANKNEQQTHALLRERLDTVKYSIKKKSKILIGKTTICPELLIENTKNGKKVVIDDKLGKNGGNAHERCYRYFANNRVEKAGYTPIIVFSGPTFAAKDKFKVYHKKGTTSVNPEKYRQEFEDFLEPEQYFISDGSNIEILVKRIEEILK